MFAKSRALIPPCVCCLGWLLGFVPPSVTADEAPARNAPARNAPAGAAAIRAAAATTAAAAKVDPHRIAQEIDRHLAQETGGANTGGTNTGSTNTGGTNTGGTNTGSKAADAVAPLSDDETFLRRVFLDLVGKPPTQEDILAFGLDSSTDKRHALVTRLLADRDFGVNWGRYWRDVIMYRRTEDRALLGAASLTDFFVRQFNENKPWSETASALITASGDVREHGETGLIVAQAGTPEDVTAEVSRIFLGIQIQCAQCHDHPTDRWKREQFHHLAAFFPRIGVRLNLEDRSLVVTTTDFAMRRRPNMNNRFFGTLEHRMPDKDDPASEGTLMQPVFFLNEQKLPVGTRDADRRGTLADWVTARDNPWFAKAFVNRVWAELVGEGFYEPIDDIGPDRECSAPQTLQALSDAFIASGYDVKWLYTTIMATQAYQRESRSRRAPDGMPFAATCAQRLRAEQLFDAMLAVLNLEGRFPESPPLAGPPGQRRDPRFQFSQVFGYDPSEPRADLAASIPQALAMMNSPLFQQAMSARRPDALGGVLARNKDDRSALVELYLNTLGRMPSEQEVARCQSYIREVNDRGEAFEDILWSLLNSTEFLYRK